MGQVLGFETPLFCSTVMSADINQRHHSLLGFSFLTLVKRGVVLWVAASYLNPWAEPLAAVESKGKRIWSRLSSWSNLMVFREAWSVLLRLVLSIPVIVKMVSSFCVDLSYTFSMILMVWTSLYRSGRSSRGLNKRVSTWKVTIDRIVYHSLILLLYIDQLFLIPFGLLSRNEAHECGTPFCRETLRGFVLETLLRRFGWVYYLWAGCCHGVGRQECCGYWAKDYWSYQPISFGPRHHPWQLRCWDWKVNESTCAAHWLLLVSKPSFAITLTRHCHVLKERVNDCTVLEVSWIG